MKATRLALVAALALPLAAAAAPIYMNFGDLFRTRVHLGEAAQLPGGGTLRPGDYDVEIAALGDENVRATFFDTKGLKMGQASGKITGPATQAHGSGGGGGAGKVSFQDLHFNAQSSRRFVKQNNAINFVVGGQGGNQILIGLLLPAVHPGGANAPIEQKVQPAK